MARDEDQVQRVALELWRRRQMRFPAFVRRMTPDAIDVATGAWALALAEAQKLIERRA